MPIKIPDNLPATKVLEEERIPIIRTERALRQDIRPLQLAILNLMPDKISTENQLLRVLGSSPLQVEISLIRTASYQSKNTHPDHLENFYDTWDNISHRRFDGLVITGAPVETMEYEDVLYWKELTDILEWSKTNVYSSFFICWAAQAALYYHHKIRKKINDVKLMGNYRFRLPSRYDPLIAGFDDEIYIPVARQTSVKRDDILENKKLDILLENKETGPCLVHENTYRRVYMFNHLEYDRDTIKNEYLRDLESGQYTVSLPVNYFPDNDVENDPPVTWRAHRNLLFGNWLNVVYQGTPFNLDDITPIA